MRMTRLTRGDRTTVVVETERNDPLYVYPTTRGISMIFQTNDKNFYIGFSLEEVEKILQCVEKTRTPSSKTVSE